jgi:predicted protein tyrosine phosphatase
MANINVKDRAPLLVPASGPVGILSFDDKFKFLRLEDTTNEHPDGFIFIDAHRVVSFDMVDGVANIDRLLELCYSSISVSRARSEESSE